MTLGGQDIGIRIFEFVAKTQFPFNQYPPNLSSVSPIKVKVVILFWDVEKKKT